MICPGQKWSDRNGGIWTVKSMYIDTVFVVGPNNMNDGRHIDVDVLLHSFNLLGDAT